MWTRTGYLRTENKYKFEIYIYSKYYNKMNILQDSESARVEIVDKIEDGEIVILPSNGVFTFNTNIFNNKSIEKIYELKQRETNTPLSVAVKDYEMAKSLIDMDSLTPSELEIIETLTTEFWPGMLSIVVKTKMDNKLYSLNNYISLECPDHSVVQSIFNQLEKPIITTSANIHKKSSCSNIEHVKSYFEMNDAITALDFDTPPRNGIENTIIKIVDSSIAIIRPGPITFEDISELLIDKDIGFSMDFQSDTIHGVTPRHYSIDKNCCLVNFITCDKLDASINALTTKYLANSILVDFGKKNIEKKAICGGYVDLSEDGDIKEALFNLFNVLHQLNKTELNNILFVDLYAPNIGLYKTIKDRLDKCCNCKKMFIPLYYD
tara:strand:- start:2615 stop:3751 length:1137 start_codon:yes stop_codon:yes gene_type:complete